MKRSTSTIAAVVAAAGLVLGTGSLAQATTGHGVYVQDYIASCEKPERTAVFVLDALGADGPTTYTVSDGTPPASVVVAAHSTGRSPVFSIPASGAHYSITASTGQTWSFTAAPDCKPVPPVVTPPVEPPVVVPPVVEPPVVVPPVTEPPVVVPPVTEVPETEVPVVETPAAPAPAPTAPVVVEQDVDVTVNTPAPVVVNGGAAPVATPVTTSAHFTG